MKLDALKFDVSDNVCLSLRILSELARRGELSVRASYQISETPTAEVLRITITQPIQKAPSRDLPIPQPRIEREMP
jgi:hypothetical protein